MKVTFIGETNFNSRGMDFSSRKEYDLDQEFAEYLVKTFGRFFEAEKVEEPKAAPVRKKRTKKAVPTEE